MLMYLGIFSIKDHRWSHDPKRHFFTSVSPHATTPPGDGLRETSQGNLVRCHPDGTLKFPGFRSSCAPDMNFDAMDRGRKQMHSRRVGEISLHVISAENRHL